MHGTRNGLKPVASGSCSLAYWLFHAITSERKDLSKIHKLKTEKSLRQTPLYLILSVETSDVGAGVHTDTQDKYRNPPAQARRVVSLARPSLEGRGSGDTAIVDLCSLANFFRRDNIA